MHPGYATVIASAGSNETDKPVPAELARKRTCAGEARATWIVPADALATAAAQRRGGDLVALVASA